MVYFTFEGVCAMPTAMNGKDLTVKLHENTRRMPLKRWDRHHHGASYVSLKNAHDHFLKRGCEFGSSKPGELTIRRGDGRYTVYISRESNGQWCVGAQKNRRKYFLSWEEVIEYLHKWGF